MEKKYKTICILIICYKQQELIKRAINSLLQQKEYGLHRIVVCDDCSPDDTWKVLQEYKKRFPDLMCIYRNDENIGIYKNLEKVTSLRGDSDLYSYLAGDDEYCDGFFKALQEYILDHDIDFSKPIGFYGDYKGITPNGQVFLKKQDVVKDKNLNLFRLYIRGYVSGRSCFVNNPVLEKFTTTIYDKGLNLAESFYDSQKHRYIEDAHYINSIGNIYYTNIGVSKELRFTPYHKEEAITKWLYFIEKLIDNKTDVRYAYAEIYRAQFLISPTWLLYIKTLFYLLTSGYPSIPSFKYCRTFVSPMKHFVLQKYEKNRIGAFIAGIIYKL